MVFREFYNKILEYPVGFYKDIPFPIEIVNFEKGDIITQYNQVENYIYFINEGIVEIDIKSYMTEKVIDFFFKDEFVCGMTSFLKQQPADVKVTALTDCYMERIGFDDLQKAYKKSFDANKFGRICTEHGYIRKSSREKDFLTKTAEERYKEMFKVRSHCISQIPVNKIAKYLGIHPESLSRIRKKINS